MAAGLKQRDYAPDAKGPLQGVRVLDLSRMFARNKKSLCLELRKPQAKEILLRLLPSAAVFLESFRRGGLPMRVMRR